MKTAQRILMAVLPLAIAVGTLVAVKKLADMEHRKHLPEGYVMHEVDGFEVYHPPGLKDTAARVAESASEFARGAATAWGRRLGGLEPPSEPVRLTLFPDHAHFQRFASSSLSEDVSHNGGFFDAATLEIALVVADLEAGGAEDMGIRHEVAHLLIGRGGGRFGTRMPVWLNEGLATWLETASFSSPDGPAPVARWVRMVAAVEPPLSLKRLTAASPASFQSRGNEVYYAYANLLVHFLVDRVPDRFWAFAKAARDGESADYDALVEAFGPAGKLEDAWQNAMERARNRWAVELSEAAERDL